MCSQWNNKKYPTRSALPCLGFASRAPRSTKHAPLQTGARLQSGVWSWSVAPLWLGGKSPRLTTVMHTTWLLSMICNLSCCSFHNYCTAVRDWPGRLPPRATRKSMERQEGLTNNWNLLPTLPCYRGVSVLHVVWAKGVQGIPCRWSHVSCFTSPFLPIVPGPGCPW